MISCPLCSSIDTVAHPISKDFPYRRCRGCDLVFLEPCKGVMDVSYTADYISNRGHDELNSFVAEAKRATARHYLAIVERFAPRKGALLEVGCSTGLSLEVAQERGWQIYGAEINEAAVSLTRRFSSADRIVAGLLKAESFPGVRFTAIVLFDVLEHMVDPNSFFEVVSAKMAPGCVVLLVTPNITSLSATILKGHWPHIFPEHVCFYSPKSIAYLLARHRLILRKIGRAGKWMSTSIIRKHLACHPRIFPSGLIKLFLDRVQLFDRVLFPFNIGEMYVIAQNE